MPPSLPSTNPARGYEVIGQVEVTTPEGIKTKVNTAQAAKRDWKQTPVSERVRILRSLRDKFFSRQSEIAQLITTEIGMPITESRDEVAWDFGYFDWFLDNAESILAPEVTLDDENGTHTIHYEPIGVAAVITPWNLPFDLFVWGVIPNLLAGNPLIYKASEECILTGQLLEQICATASLPNGVLNFIHGNGVQGEQLVDEPVDLIWFTGSSAIGEKLYELAGKKFIRATMELGGSNPGVVFEDVDIPSIVPDIIGKRFGFCGQTCDAVKRLIVHKSIAPALIEVLKAAVEAIRVGDPADPSTQMGPLAAARQLTLLKAQLADAVQNGAHIITGGRQPTELPGAFIEPTLLSNVKPSMRVWQEEVFGPVLPIVTFETEQEALQLANDTRYGLGASLFSKDLKLATRVTSQIEAGNVTINGANHFSPANPFGGYKRSGIGREHGTHGLRELCQIKVVSVATGT